MNIQEDYIHFLVENKDILDELKEHKTLTYDYLEPVFLVLDFFNEIDFDYPDEDKEDLYSIFENGFRFLYNSFENIKRILSDSFEDEIEDLIKFDKNLYLYLKVDEADTMLNEENQLISGLVTQLDSSFEYRKVLDDKASEKIDEELEIALEEDRLTPDIFCDIAEEVGIEIF